MILGVQQGDGVAAAGGTDDRGGPVDTDLGCGDAHPLAERVHLCDPLRCRVQRGDDPSGVLCFLRQLEGTCSASQARIVALDDADSAHRLARGLGRLAGRQMEASSFVDTAFADVEFDEIYHPDDGTQAGGLIISERRAARRARHGPLRDAPPDCRENVIVSTYLR